MNKARLYICRCEEAAGNSLRRYCITDIIKARRELLVRISKLYRRSAAAKAGSSAWSKFILLFIINF